MRNLKRVLSLALALVMVLGMMVITTSAATFADKDEITYTEAVDVISAIGVITGDNGSFYPNRALTREEGAALICYLLMGKDKADKLVGSGNFADVASNRWSAGEIDYCANLGIILGYTDADGKQVFNPKGELTAVAYGRMLLGALGYDGGIEGYTGTNWASSIAADMIDVGLDVRGVDMDAVLTREQAAQMTLQALKSPMVKYADKGSSIVIGGVEISTGASEAEERTDVNKTNTDPAVEIGYNDVQDGKLQFCEKYFPTLYLKADGGNNADAYGRPAHTWYFGGVAAKDKVGVYADKAAATVLVTGMKNDTLAEIAEAEGRKLATGVSDASYGKGTSVELYTNFKGEITSALPLTTKLGQIVKVVKTTDKDAKYTYDVTIKIGASLYPYKDTALAGFDAETMVKDTYITILQGTGVATVALADKVTGTVTATGGNAGTKSDYVKVDGEKVEYATSPWVVDAVNYTDIFDIYVDANGYAIGTVKAKAVKEATNIFFVTDADIDDKGTFAGGKVAKLAVVNLDGSAEIVNMVISKQGKVTINGTETAITSSGIAVSDGFYEYTVNDAGEIKTIKAVGTSGTAASGVKDTKELLADGNYVTFTKDAAGVNVNGTTMFATTATTVTVIDTAKKSATTITGYDAFENLTYELDPNNDSSGNTEVAGILYIYDKDVLKTVYVMGATLSVVDDAVVGVYVSTGDTYMVQNTTYKDVVYNVKGEDVTYRVAALASTPAFAEITVTDGVATLDDATDEAGEAMYGKADQYVSKVTDTYILIGRGGTTPVYFADKVAYYDVTNINKNGVVADDAIVVGDVINYTTNREGKITAVYTVYANKEDGAIAFGATLTNAEKAYLAGKIGWSSSIINALHADCVVIQFTVPAGTSTCVVKFWAESAPATVYTAPISPVPAGGGIGGQELYWASGDPVGTWGYEVVLDGVVTLTGVCELGV